MTTCRKARRALATVSVLGTSRGHRVDGTTTWPHPRRPGRTPCRSGMPLPTAVNAITGSSRRTPAPRRTHGGARRRSRWRGGRRDGRGSRGPQPSVRGPRLLRRAGPVHRRFSADGRGGPSSHRRGPTRDVSDAGRPGDGPRGRLRRPRRLQDGVHAGARRRSGGSRGAARPQGRLPSRRHQAGHCPRYCGASTAPRSTRSRRPAGNSRPPIATRTAPTSSPLGHCSPSHARDHAPTATVGGKGRVRTLRPPPPAGWGLGSGR